MPGKKSGNQALDAAIDSLKSIDTQGHTNTGKYRNMSRALDDLVDCIEKYYPENIGDAPQLTADQLQELNDAYSTAIRECRNYTSGKGDSRKSGYGQARLKTVRSIEQILNEDLYAIQTADPSKNVTLPALINETRALNAGLNVADKDLKVVGANSSTRVPIRIQTSTGQMEGFFTEDYKLIDPKGIYKSLEEKGYYSDPALARLFDKKEFGSFDVDGFNNDLSGLQKIKGKMKANNITKDALISDRNRFILTVRDELLKMNDQNEGYVDRILYDIAQTPQKRALFMEYVEDGAAMASEYFGNHKHGKIPVNQNIPNRNVGMSRVADLMGMGSLIAKASRMKLSDKDGYEREGVFQETAKGTDLEHPKKDDPIFDLKDHPEALNNGPLLKQLADLQVLDYICGNTDRHLKNMLYQVENVNGQLKVKGIMGIDNDRSFGLVDKKNVKNTHFLVGPEMMSVISQSAYDSIRTLDKNNLKLTLKDLNFSDAEISACIQRVGDIKKAVRDNKLRVVPDEEFANLNIQDLSRERKMNKNFTQRNIFGRVKYLPQTVPERPLEDEPGIEYNQATVKDKDYQITKGDVYLSDLKADLDSLNAIAQKFKETDRALHKDGGGFKWMLSSLNALKDELSELDRSHGDNYKLSDDEVKKLDTLYRNLRSASRDYMADHQNPSSEMGQTRRNGAELMSNMRPLQLGEPKKVITKKTIEDMNKEFDRKRKAGENKPQLKERRTKKTVQRAKDLAQKDHNNQGPVSSH